MHLRKEIIVLYLLGFLINFNRHCRLILDFVLTIASLAVPNHVYCRLSCAFGYLGIIFSDYKESFLLYTYLLFVIIPSDNLLLIVKMSKIIKKSKFTTILYCSYSFA